MRRRCGDPHADEPGRSLGRPPPPHNPIVQAGLGTRSRSSASNPSDRRSLTRPIGIGRARACAERDDREDRRLAAFMRLIPCRGRQLSLASHERLDGQTDGQESLRRSSGRSWRGSSRRLAYPDRACPVRFSLPFPGGNDSLRARGYVSVPLNGQFRWTRLERDWGYRGASGGHRCRAWNLPPGAVREIRMDSPWFVATATSWPSAREASSP